MANTYHQIIIQGIFAVKYRRAIIQKEWKDRLMANIGNLINETQCSTILVNGVEDHVHSLFHLKPTISVSDLMKIVKARSSKWINDMCFIKHKFEWQGGYGAFSCSPQEIDRVYKYIENQDEHHRKKTFREEYIDMLQQFGIAFDKKYIFHDLI